MCAHLRVRVCSLSANRKQRGGTVMHRLTFNCSCIYFNYVSQGMAMNAAGLRVGN